MCRALPRLQTAEAVMHAQPAHWESEADFDEASSGHSHPPSGGTTSPQLNAALLDDPGIAWEVIDNLWLENLVAASSVGIVIRRRPIAAMWIEILENEEHPEEVAGDKVEGQDMEGESPTADH
ncbi:hypothetical protein NDU88_003003 [Pleurodeles waltl]|uniref:Uncharacterized protein n=1 Tax=Pleurodeles waltl TaxID=8319 RepID=A0AAV7NI50_PLEWA|nr:hypothetical protein NDU88_003003 [Pleurodeles waltl]